MSGNAFVTYIRDTSVRLFSSEIDAFGLNSLV